MIKKKLQNKVGHRLPIAFFLGLSFLWISCTERIDIHTDDAPPQLAIYGYITTDTMAHTIKITRSSGYFATTRPEGISHATVQILSDKGDVFNLNELVGSPGVYQTDPDVFGVETWNYTLKVSLDFDGDGNQETYEASSYLPKAVQIDTITLAPSVLKDMIEVRVTGRLPELQLDEHNFYSLHVYRNQELVNDSLKGIDIFRDDLTSRNISNLACFYLDQEKDKSKLSPNDTVTLRIDAVTKAYADFISEAQSEVWGYIPMFSGPPANISTNITCTKGSVVVSGFFTAYSGRKKGTFYIP